jgi:hypothetical protein
VESIGTGGGSFVRSAETIHWGTGGGAALVIQFFEAIKCTKRDLI